eukprot:CAMPEP_0195100796 /NCGR_PEP_ID=MMETSP0448-20130528/64737_1 /TAXON_ID=66468 /ORGANISM="Heterocapsa triquestra, Strain CCMP 448" /LENGTH=69 /DNA_ID=CAMNT_0040136011 /DNA_START=14 /DNA_END=221 /DNA_ORIENTATION=-
MAPHFPWAVRPPPAQGPQFAQFVGALGIQRLHEQACLQLVQGSGNALCGHEALCPLGAVDASGVAVTGI